MNQQFSIGDRNVVITDQVEIALLLSLSLVTGLDRCGPVSTSIGLSLFDHGFQ